MVYALIVMAALPPQYTNQQKEILENRRPFVAIATEGIEIQLHVAGPAPTLGQIVNLPSRQETIYTDGNGQDVRGPIQEGHTPYYAVPWNEAVYWFSEYEFQEFSLNGAGLFGTKRNDWYALFYALCFAAGGIGLVVHVTYYKSIKSREDRKNLQIRTAMISFAYMGFGLLVARAVGKGVVTPAETNMGFAVVIGFHTLSATIFHFYSKRNGRSVLLHAS